MDNVKEAFQKVKQDITSLKEEIEEMKSCFIDINENLKEINNKIFNFVAQVKEIKQEKNEKNNKEDKRNLKTNTLVFQTNPQFIPTDNLIFKPLNDQILGISTGNQGVPTDRQTDKQTNRQTEINPKILENTKKNILDRQTDIQTESLDKGQIKQENTLDNAVDILRSLDSIKKEVRLKFKRLTDQEFLVFSTLYQFDEKIGYSDYKTLSKKLNLTESSIRDYIGRLIKKGIPIEKTKLNNKQIQLKISTNLKEIATLPTILQLRDL